MSVSVKTKRLSAKALREIEELEYMYEREQLIRDARKSFWRYCQAKAPDFYLPQHWHLMSMCDKLQQFVEGKLLKADGKPYTKLRIHMPPRMGKTRTLVNLNEWQIGRDPSLMFMSASYNEDLASDFSRFVKNSIQEQPNLPDQITFSDIFPGVNIKHGDNRLDKWALENQFFTFLSTSIGGSATGRGTKRLTVDDMIKNSKEAANENFLNALWDWYVNTLMSRREEGTLEIHCYTRWSTKDIAGRLDEVEPGEWYVINLEAYTEDQGMLCPDLLSYESYLERKNKMDPIIFDANFHGKPVNAQGCLYKLFRLYDSLPDFEEIWSYTDTADEGSDLLVSIAFGVLRGEAYLLDVLCTDEGAEITEGQTARMFFTNRVSRAKVESNNGGRYFARNVERILWDTHMSRNTAVEWFHQSENKIARIISLAHWIQQHVYYPRDWTVRWERFSKIIQQFQRIGKNEYDDPPDALTGVAEMLDVGAVWGA